MNFLWALLLGFLQGFTEFLPVSSSGHLVLVQSLIPGFSQPGVLFDVTLHFGTLLAILVFFRKKIISLSKKYLVNILVATVPAVLFGLFLQNYIQKLFSSVFVVGFALLLTSFLNFLTSKQKEGEKKLDTKKSLFVGLMQAFAIVPGISRSGATIFAGVKSGLSKKDAAEFSFLMSVPAVFAANVLEIYSNFGTEVNLLSYSLGFLASFISGIIAIKVLLNLLKKDKYKIFFFYCLILGILILL